MPAAVAATAAAAAACLVLAGCRREPFSVLLTIDPGATAVPARLVLYVEDDPFSADCNSRSEFPAEFFSAPGESNRLLVIPCAGTTLVRARADAFDAAGDAVGVGTLEVPAPPDPERVAATLLLVAPACGDGLASPPGEACDGEDLAGATCSTADPGYASGALACTAGCAFDASACVPADCGDGIIGPLDGCDGANLGAASCASFGFTNGTLACTSICDLDPSGCFTCGDGLRTGPEPCDGADTGGMDCAGLGLGFTGGTLGCTGACTFETSGCVTCGDGVVSLGGEQCDGANLAAQSCLTLMHDGGALSCTPSCTFDESACSDCGDGVAELPDEACDGADLLGNDCTTILQGWIGGALACATDCTLDTSACVPPLNCGNGSRDVTEECDGAALGGATCSSATGGALPSGTIACSGGCVLDTSGCFECGNGTREPAELCDGTDFGGETCVTQMHDGGSLVCEPGCLTWYSGGCTDCGDGVVEPPELCDGSAFGGATCVSLGMGSFSGGDLLCVGTCTAVSTAACCGTPGPPPPRKPMNGSYTGSAIVDQSFRPTLRPTFVWDRPAVPCPMGGTPPALTYAIQISTDPAFGTVVAGTTGVTDTFWTPSSDLLVPLAAPVGDVFYWRVSATGGSLTSVWSEVWYVHVGQSSHDADGDGFGDLVVGAPGAPSEGFDDDAGAAYLVRGNSALVDVPPLGGTDGAAAYGTSVAFIGDGDGSGRMLFAVGAPGAAGAEGYVDIVGLDTTSDALTVVAKITGLGAGEAFGAAVAGAGDVDEDGLDDLVVGAPAYAGTSGPGEGRVDVFSAGAGWSLLVSIGSPGGAGTRFGAAVDGGGDVDGDGAADLVAGAPGLGDGTAYLFLGGAALGAAYDESWTGGAGDRLGAAVALGGDANDDGYADLLLGAPQSMGAGAGYALLVYGAPAAPRALGAGMPMGSDPDDEFGAALDWIGRADADALDDFAIGAPGADLGAGAITIFAGAAFVTFGGGTVSESLGASIASAGDVDLDGFDDLIAGAPTADPGGFNQAGCARTFVAVSWTPTDTCGEAPDDRYGTSVAGR